jgi:hypothetical protein
MDENEWNYKNENNCKIQKKFDFLRKLFSWVQKTDFEMRSKSQPELELQLSSQWLSLKITKTQSESNHSFVMYLFLLHFF